MTLDWRLPDENTYLSPHERLIVSARFHPVSAVYPFVRATLGAFVALWFWSVYGIVATVVIVIVMVQWLRKHRVLGDLSFILSTIVVVGFLFLTGFAADIGALIIWLMVVATGVAVYQLIDFFYTQLFLTDQRIFRVSGILTRQVATMPLKALTDIRYEQTVLGRVFNYGHFHVESAGQDQALGSLHFVAQPGRFYQVVMTEALEPPQESARRIEQRPPTGFDPE